MRRVKHFLIVSETFYSIQGEGASVGRPAVFLRLAGCNLRCPGFTYQDPKTGAHLGCDTKSIWLKGERFTIDALLDEWQAQGWMEKFEKGAHLVLTGGEPTLQQPGLITLLERLDAILPVTLFVEMETNGTFIVDSRLMRRINQFNVSPKLRHSGEAREKAVCPDVLAAFSASEKAHFKFVISAPDDIQEVLSEYIAPFSIPAARVWLMPEGGTRAAIHEKKSWLIEQCKRHAVNFTTRLHIDVWDEATGV
jgi:7-carboxy-7-deazaguanine synthase